MRKNKTTNQFKHEVYSLVGDEYEILGEYVNANSKLEVKHNKCNSVYSVTPSKFLNGNRCPTCKRPNYHRDTKKLKEEVYSLVKDEYEVLSEYTNSNKHIKIKHNKCGFIYEVIPTSFLKGSRCPQCAGNKKKTTEEFKEEVYSLVKDEYIVLGEYINSKTPIKMQHDSCKYIYTVAPNGFLMNKRCPKCAGNKKKTTEEFKEEVYNLVKDEYEALGEYINASTLIKLKHNTCGFVYEVRPNSFLNGTRCPKCCSRKKKTTVEFKEKVYNLIKDNDTDLEKGVK